MIAGLAPSQVIEQLRRHTAQNALAFLQDLDWADFELVVAEYFARCGWEACLSKPGADQGVDIYLAYEDRRILVQCKHWNKPVSVRVAREMYGLFHHHNVERVILIGLGGFAGPARKFCDGKPIWLLTGFELVECIQGEDFQDCVPGRVLKPWLGLRSELKQLPPIPDLFAQTLMCGYMGSWGAVGSNIFHRDKFSGSWDGISQTMGVRKAFGWLKDKAPHVATARMAKRCWRKAVRELREHCQIGTPGGPSVGGDRLLSLEEIYAARISRGYYGRWVAIGSQIFRYKEIEGEWVHVDDQLGAGYASNFLEECANYAADCEHCHSCWAAASKRLQAMNQVPARVVFGEMAA